MWEDAPARPEPRRRDFRPWVARDIPQGVDMATQDDVDALHRAANIPTSDTEYTDEFLSALIDQQGTIESAAAVVWRYKAAKLAAMVDTTESGSSRKLSDLHKNALEMAAALTEVDVVNTGGRSFTVAVERM